MRPRSVHKLPKCRKCGAPRSSHLARTFNCPIVDYDKGDIISFHRYQVYEPDNDGNRN